MLMTVPEQICEHKMYFMNEIKRLGEVLIRLQESVMDVALVVEQLKASEKIKSAIFGALGGLLSSAVAALVIKTIWGLQ